MERCYSKDPENLKKFPSGAWVNGAPPDYITKRYCKKMSQNDARNMCKIGNTSVKQEAAPPATYQQSAHVAWTSPDIYSAVPADASTYSAQSSSISKEDRMLAKMDMYELARLRSRYDFVPEPEDLTPTQFAMPARASAGEDIQELSNLW